MCCGMKNMRVSLIILEEEAGRDLRVAGEFVDILYGSG